MPKIQGSLADVSTTYQLIEPDTYTFIIDEIEYKDEGVKKLENGEEQVLYIFKNKVDDPASDANGRMVYDRIYWYKNNGEVNPIAQIQMKRYFEAVLGEEEANRDDLDSDELLKGRFMAEVTIRSYKKNDGGEGQSNELRNISPVE